MVLDIDEERRRISPGLKQCKSNPWQQFAETHNKGDRVEGKIKSITDFGIFIGTDGGIDGWFTCLTSHGTLQAKKQFVNTKRRRNRSSCSAG